MQKKEAIDNLINRLFSGDRIAAARIMTLIENESRHGASILSKLYPKTGSAYRIGITGPPGAGKSSLVEKLALEARKKNFTVGIIAVDPTSPFSGGAFLGDRIRMQNVTQDSGVFMRSMATRGSLGGLARTTQEVADVLDAFGKDLIFIETVGVGQSELDVVNAVDTTVVVLVPESGGGIQAMKAGLMEIANIFALNKSDRPGSMELKSEVEEALNLNPESKNWRAPVTRCSCLKGWGYEKIFQEILAHREHVINSGIFKEKRLLQAEEKIRELVKASFEEEIWGNAENRKTLKKMAGQISEGKLDPFTAAKKFMDTLKK